MMLDCVALRKYLLLLELKGCEFAKCYGDRYTRSIKKYVKHMASNRRHYLRNVRFLSRVWMKRMEIVKRLRGGDNIYYGLPATMTID